MPDRAKSLVRHFFFGGLIFRAVRKKAGTKGNGQQKTRSDAGLRTSRDLNDRQVVEVSGIEPLTSCMPCKRSPS